MKDHNPQNKLCTEEGSRFLTVEEFKALTSDNLNDETRAQLMALFAPVYWSESACAWLPASLEFIIENGKIMSLATPNALSLVDEANNPPPLHFSLYIDRESNFSVNTRRPELILQVMESIVSLAHSGLTLAEACQRLTDTATELKLKQVIATIDESHANKPTLSSDSPTRGEERTRDDTFPR